MKIGRFVIEHDGELSVRFHRYRFPNYDTYQIGKFLVTGWRNNES